MVNTYEGLLAILVQSEIRFMLVGGLAVSLNGFVRTTEDMDILVDADPDNLERLLACLVNFGDGYARELSVKDFTDEEGAIRVQEEFDLDIFVRMRGKKYIDLAPHMRKHEIAGGALVPYLDAEGLVSLKQGSMRDKDRIDVISLLRITNEPEYKKVTSLDSLRTGKQSAENEPHE